MSQPLPIGDYKWIKFRTDGEIDIVRRANIILNLPDDSEAGYIFEVDLHYPESLHSAHSDFPFCAERCKLPKQAFDILGPAASEFPKLLLTLFDKEKYVIHYRMLKLALRHGVQLKKVHRILKFKQSTWLKKYIDLNTELRKMAVNKFESDFFKWLINAIFGKTMENVRSRIELKLVNKWKGRCGARMLISRPNFKRFTIFDEELIAIELQKTSITMDKPIAVGMSILDVSKLAMYSFLYDYLKPKYGENCRVAYTDTDSFIIDVTTDDFYADIRENISMFDTSSYPIPNEYNIERMNKKIPGLFKDEMNGNIITKFVGIQAKSYAVQSLDSDEYKSKKDEKLGVNKRSRAHCGKFYNEDMKKLKGVKKSVVAGKISFNDYLECIENKRVFKAKQNTIRSIKHNVYSIQQEKVALRPFDDKRYLVGPDNKETLPWGHYIIDFHEEAIRE